MVIWLEHKLNYQLQKPLIGPLDRLHTTTTTTTTGLKWPIYHNDSGRCMLAIKLVTRSIPQVSIGRGIPKACLVCS